MSVGVGVGALESGREVDGCIERGESARDIRGEEEEGEKARLSSREGRRERRGRRTVDLRRGPFRWNLDDAGSYRSRSRGE